MSSRTTSGTWRRSSAFRGLSLALVVAGALLIAVNAFALRIERRYTHSALWRCTVERIAALRPSLLLGWQHYDRLGRSFNLLGIALGVILMVVGLT